jgi:hypothetical protein
MDVGAAMTSVMEAGVLTPAQLAEAATRLGAAPEQVAAKVETLRAAFAIQAATAVGSQDILDWANEHARDALTAAVRSQVNEGSLDGYKAVTKAYMESLPDHRPDLILASPDAKARGITRDARGRITLMVPGVGTVDWKTALRSGLIGPAFKR